MADAETTGPVPTPTPPPRRGTVGGSEGEEPSNFVYRLARAIALLALKVFYRFRAYGVDNLPPSGPVLLAANHQSYLDPPIVGTPFRRPMVSLARHGLFQSRFRGWLLPRLHAVPIRQGAGDTAAIRAILEELARGRVVLVFPEGSRTSDGRVGPFQPGIWLIVRRAACPVVPVAVEGAFDVWPRHRRRPRLRGRVASAIGRPISNAELIELGPDAGLDLIRSRIEELRLGLRAQMRQATAGRFPPEGPADAPGGPPGPPPGP